MDADVQFVAHASLRIRHFTPGAAIETMLHSGALDRGGAAIAINLLDLKVYVPFDTLGPDRHRLHVAEGLLVRAVGALLGASVNGLACRIVPEVGEVGKGHRYRAKRADGWVELRSMVSIQYLWVSGQGGQHGWDDTEIGGSRPAATRRP